jgi:ABC-type branched-subunit amino acid transport system ATPase component
MLQLDGVSAAIAGAQVLRAVSLQVGVGSRVALIGRNGAGKTSTLRAIMGLLPLTGGSVRLDGRDLAAVPSYARTQLGLGYAPEERRLFPRFTVEENLLLPAEVLHLQSDEVSRRRSVVRAILPELDELRPRRAASLSGGQGKMVALGRALMTGTRLLLLDEPFQGLAPALARHYSDALRRLRDMAPELAILITESNPSLVTNLVDETFIIERGEIAERRTGTPHDGRGAADRSGHNLKAGKADHG